MKEEKIPKRLRKGKPDLKAVYLVMHREKKVEKKIKSETQL